MLVNQLRAVSLVPLEKDIRGRTQWVFIELNLLHTAGKLISLSLSLSLSLSTCTSTMPMSFGLLLSPTASA